MYANCKIKKKQLNGMKKTIDAKFVDNHAKFAYSK